MATDRTAKASGGLLQREMAWEGSKRHGLMATAQRVVAANEGVVVRLGDGFGDGGWTGHAPS